MSAGVRPLLAFPQPHARPVEWRGSRRGSILTRMQAEEHPLSVRVGVGPAGSVTYLVDVPPEAWARGGVVTAACGRTAAGPGPAMVTASFLGI